MSIRRHVLADAAAVAAEALARVRQAAQEAIAARGRFAIVLAGGGTPRAVYERLRGLPTDWSRWHVYFGDERCLPPEHPERNSRMAATAWLDHITLPAAQLHVIPAEAGAVIAAPAYAARLRGVGDFDLVLLGLGEDGHTASLFPGGDWGEGPDAPDALPVLHAPKPPPERVSLSAARLGRARQVLFLVTGEAKRDALNRWAAGEKIPAAAVRPAGGVDVLTDVAA